MSALAHISRVLAVLFALFAAFWVALPLLNALGRTYEGGGMVFTAIIFGGFFAVASLMLYGCYRHARLEHGSSIVRGFVWCFVVLAGLGASAFAARIIWVTVPAFTR
jgi:hypothetical protein